MADSLQSQIDSLNRRLSIFEMDHQRTVHEGKMVDIQQSSQWDKIQIEMDLLKQNLDTRLATADSSVSGSLSELRSELQRVKDHADDRKSLLEANTKLQEALRKQLDTRWDFFRVIASAMSLFLAITFGYQIWKAVEITGYVSQMDANERTHNAMKENSVLQLTVGEDLTRAAMELTAGNRQFQMLASETAKSHSERAAKYVEKAIAQIDVYDAAHPATNAAPQKSSDPSRIPSINTSELRNQSNAVKFEVLCLKSMCCFRLGQTHEMPQIAEEMMKLDPENWQAPHFRALALSEQADAKSKDVEEAFQKSIGLSPWGNPDIMNLAEYQFVREEFSECLSTLERFRKSDTQPPPQRKLLGRFFQDACQCAISGKGDPLEGINADTYLSKLSDVPWSPTVLAEYAKQLEKPNYGGKVPATEKKALISGILNIVHRAAK